MKEVKGKRKREGMNEIENENKREMELNRKARMKHGYKWKKKSKEGMVEREESFTFELNFVLRVSVLGLDNMAECCYKLS